MKETVRTQVERSEPGRVEARLKQCAEDHSGAENGNSASFSV
jgi:hypothetical protein